MIKKNIQVKWLAIAIGLILTCGILSPFLVAAASVVSDNDTQLITQSFTTYKGNSKYDGATIASHISANDFADLTIKESGGTHIDGAGSTVFSNYVIFRIDLLFDGQTKKIGNTGVKVAKDNCDWNDMDKANNYKYGDPNTDTEQYIAYGAVSAIRINGDGSATKYIPMFSKGNTAISEQIFNVDGNYTIYVFFQTQKGNEIQKHVLSWSFKIRTKIYLLDEETGYAIKDSGISNKNVVIDYADRDETLSQIKEKVQVNCVKDGYRQIDIVDGMVLKAEPGISSRYEFKVEANGFVAERFEFVIDTVNLQESLFFGNLRKKISTFHYEAEEYFYMTWTENPNNPIVVKIQFVDANADYEGPFFDDNGNPLADIPIETIDYQQGDRLDNVGVYHICAHSDTYSTEYWIDVVEGDSPSYNYGILSAKRFNNFKTKWYQVYDHINDRYLCFDMDEYMRAYNAAMTVEYSTVDRSTGHPFYNGRYYSDNIDVTVAMNEYVFANNLQTIYYDPDDFSDSDESLRTFSSAAFDNTIYLNDEFQFVKLHGAEVDSIVAIGEDGREFPIKFFTPISEQNIPHGKYKIVERDKYGNETSYVVYRDKKAPVVTVNVNGTPTPIENDSSITVNNSFAFIDFYDDFDGYAVLKVIAPSGEIRYFYQEEYKGVAFVKKGKYTICTYDRNNNMVSFNVSIV